MGTERRLVLGLLLLFGLARLVAYVVYAVFTLGTPLEAFHLEAKMVLLAYRVQAGDRLYPAWQDYPHVANFFSPVYFVLVGLLGRLFGAGLPGLFSIGRAVSFASGLLSSLVVAWYLGRKYGRGAALAGGVLSLGAAPMIGFSVMARPDVLAEFLGIAGFFLAGRRIGRGCLAGCGLLVLAMLTKQTVGTFLLAAALALWLEGRRRHAAILFGGCLAALGAIVGIVTLLVEPEFARCLLGESATPWDLAGWQRTFGRVCRLCPDLLVFSALGLAYWSRGPLRDARLFSLAAVLLAASVLGSGKRGADLNYYLSLRIVEGLAAGSLWHSGRLSTTRGGRIGSAAAVLLATVALAPGVLFTASQAEAAWYNARFMNGPLGRAGLLVYGRLLRSLEDPKARILTDSGLLDLYQKERAAFGDPWQFRLLAETGRIRLTKMERWIDAEAYTLIVTTSDLDSPEYASYEFGLPMALVRRARDHYVKVGNQAGLFFYKPRGSGPSPRAADVTR
jgi:hypothetical protein